MADTALALALAVPTVGGLVADEQLEATTWLIGPLAALTALPVAARRYRPLLVFVVTVAAWLSPTPGGLAVAEVVRVGVLGYGLPVTDQPAVLAAVLL